MPSSRIAIVAAVVLGASSGALLALVFAGPARNQCAPPAPSSESAPAPAAPAPVAAGPTPSAFAAAPQPTDAGAAADASGTPEDFSTTARRCAWGYVEDCLRAADAVEAGRGTRPDPDRALEFRRRARTLDLEACVAKRDPAPCLRVARLVAAGIGGSRDEAQARVLTARAAELCAARPGAACAVLDAGSP